MSTLNGYTNGGKENELLSAIMEMTMATLGEYNNKK